MSFIEEEEFEAECIGTAAGIDRHTEWRVSRTGSLPGPGVDRRV